MLPSVEAIGSAIGHELRGIAEEHGPFRALQAFFSLSPELFALEGDARDAAFRRLTFALVARTMDREHPLSRLDDVPTLLQLLGRELDRTLGRRHTVDEMFSEIVGRAWKQVRAGFDGLETE